MARAARSSLLDVDTPAGPARLHVSAVGRPRAVVVLGHGAGRGVDTADLLGLAGALPSEGVSVVLVDQPWVVAGRRVAAPPPTLDAAWVPAVVAARRAAGTARTPLVLGGRSAGARVACRTSPGTSPDALLLLAFPLLPPGARGSADRRAAALETRRAELAVPLGAGVPVVVAQGERDTFGTGGDLRRALGPVEGLEVVDVADADHALTARHGGADPAPVLLAAALRAVALARGE